MAFAAIEGELSQGAHASILTLEPPFSGLGSIAGGAALTTRTHHKWLNRLGIPTTLVGPQTETIPDGLLPYPIKLYDLKKIFSDLGRNEDPDDVTSDQLMEIYNEKSVVDTIHALIPKGPGIINTHFYTSWSLIKDGARNDGKQYAYFHHSPFSEVRKLYDPRVVLDGEQTKASLQRTLAEEWLLQHSNAVIFFTRAEAIITRKLYHNLSTAQIRVIPLGFDTKKFNPERKDALRHVVRERFGIQENERVLYMQARIGASQGQLLLAQLYEHYLEDRPNWRLAIIGGAARGEESYLEAIQEIARRSKGKIILTGPMEPDEGHSLGDIAFGFKLETWGFSNGEALAMGNPLVTQENPIHQEVYGGNHGVLYLDISRMNDTHYVDGFMGDFISRVELDHWQEEARRINPQKVAELTWQRSANELKGVMAGMMRNPV